MFERIIDRLTNSEFQIFFICFIITVIVIMILFYTFDIIFARKKININYYKMSFEFIYASLLTGLFMAVFSLIPAFIILRGLGFNFNEYDNELFLFAFGIPSLTITSILITLRKIIIKGVDMSQLNEKVEKQSE